MKKGPGMLLMIGAAAIALVVFSACGNRSGQGQAAGGPGAVSQSVGSPAQSAEGGKSPSSEQSAQLAQLESTVSDLQKTLGSMDDVTSGDLSVPQP